MKSKLFLSTVLSSLIFLSTPLYSKAYLAFFECDSTVRLLLDPSERRNVAVKFLPHPTSHEILSHIPDTDDFPRESLRDGTSFYTRIKDGIFNAWDFNELSLETFDIDQREKKIILLRVKRINDSLELTVFQENIPKRQWVIKKCVGIRTTHHQFL